MRRTTLTLLVAATALVPPSAAGAKEISRLVVCGASGCSDLTRAVSRDDHTLIGGGTPVAPLDRRAPYYAIRLGIGMDGDAVESVRTRWVPSAALLQGEDGTWMALDDPAVREVRGLVRGIEPYPASRLRLDLTPRGRPVVRAGVGSGGALPARTYTVQSTADDGGDWLLWVVGNLAAVAVIAAAVAFRRRRRT
jgi:hypothetical protein